MMVWRRSGNGQAAPRDGRALVAAALIAAVALTAGTACQREPTGPTHAVMPAAPATPAAPAPPAKTPGAPPPASAGKANEPAKPAPAPGLPKGVDAADLDAAERKVLAEVFEEQFCPCGKARSFRAALDAGDCALASRLARFCVQQLQQGYGKRKVVTALLKEIERLNTVVPLDLAAAPRLGPADAKVLVVVFSDFECPFCRRASAPILRLQKHYAIGLAFMHYPLEMAHPHAEGAARAAWAAHRQGKFWQMHDALFAHSPDLEWPQVQKIAKEIGLDFGRFARDVESAEAKAAIAADKEQGRKAGVDGTPTFFVDGRRAETLDQLQEGIREALAARPGAKVAEPLDLGDADVDDPLAPAPAPRPAAAGAAAGEAEAGEAAAPTP